MKKQKKPKDYEKSFGFYSRYEAAKQTQ